MESTQSKSYSDSLSKLKTCITQGLENIKIQLTISNNFRSIS